MVFDSRLQSSPLEGYASHSLNRVFREEPSTAIEIHSWMSDVCEEYKYPMGELDHHVQCRSMGSSWSGNSLKYLKVSPKRRGFQESRKTIVLFGGLDGSNWLSVSALLWFFKLIVSHHPVARQLRNNYMFVIMPVANPDGFDYSHRMKDQNWLKNFCPPEKRERQTVERCPADTNLNYNFESEFSYFQNASSLDQNSQYYAGTYANSAREVRDISSALKNMDAEGAGLMVLNVIGTGKLWTIPYGSGRRDHRYADSFRVATGAIEGIHNSRRNRGLWRAGNTNDIEGAPRTGSLEDFVAGNTEIPYSFNVALAPGSRGVKWGTTFDDRESAMDLLLAINGAIRTDKANQFSDRNQWGHTVDARARSWSFF